MTWGTVATIGGSVVGGYLSGKGATDAANTQSQSAREAMQQNREMFNIQNEQQRPYREAGYASLNKISDMMPYLTKQYGAEDFSADPGYQFRLQQGMGQTQNVANQAGGAIGGNALKALNDYNQGAASTEYGNAFNRFQTGRTNIYNTLAGIAGIGQTAQSQTNQLAQNSSNNIGNAMISSGGAQATAQVANANAYSNMAQNIGNKFWQYKQQNPGAQQGLTMSGGGSPDYTVG